MKSENAAKSYTQPNKYLLDFLKKQDYLNCVLDYGCGKGRYTLALCKISKIVVAVDSSIQITRRQTIWGKSTSLLEWAKGIPNLQIMPVENFDCEENKYDFILNSNVLSAIPFEHERIAILRNIKIGLNYSGRALITSQYRNSYFSTYSNNPNAHAFNDGWIINRRGNYSFYGIIGKDKLLEYARLVGLSVVDVFLHDGSAFLIVKK